MHHTSWLAESVSMTEIPDAVRPATPVPEERTFKSLFTLADVAAKRRANRNIRKLTVKTDENRYETGETAASLNLRRSKSSGDVAVQALGENSRAVNAASANHAVGVEKTLEPIKVDTARGRAAVTSTSPSRIPKAKSPVSLQASDSFPPTSDDEEEHSSVSNTAADISETDILSIVDDALFVMLTPPGTPARQPTKKLTLAAHTPSLPKVASPLSPRINHPWVPRPSQPRVATRNSPGTGHTNASLHLTKSHWELRYEAWIRSLRTHRRPRSARSYVRPATISEESAPRSRFPEPPTNPALFPRAGMLTPKSLRHHAAESPGDSRSTLELDWAMRGWPMDKVQRTLFVHDMGVRAWFPLTPPRPEDDEMEQPESSDLDLRRLTPGPDDEERERERAMRRWEWDWELRWRVIEGMAEDENDRDRAECEYDVFLAEEDQAYGGCKVAPGPTVHEEEWDSWSEDAMEIDAVL